MKPGLLKKPLELLLGVPVFVKVLGIAVGLIVLFGGGTFWQIHQTHRQFDRSDSVVAEHVAKEAAVLKRDLARMMAYLTVVGLLMAWLMALVLVRPLDELVTGTRRVQSGDFTIRVPVRSRDDIGELAAAFNEMAGALENKEKSRQLLARQVMAAEEDERKRVARELHDQTGQALTSLIAGLSALEMQPMPATERMKLADLRRLAEQTLDEVHDLSRTLRPAALDDLGLEPALVKHCQLFSKRSGVEVKVATVGLGPEARLPGEVEVAVYRIVQEALTNAYRHGQARRVQVMVDHQVTRLLVIVADDGKGFVAEKWREYVAQGGHLGLLGIEERVGLFGGKMCLESVPGGGTQLFVEIELPDQRAET